MKYLNVFIIAIVRAIAYSLANILVRFIIKDKKWQK
jgi:hypothetical protein